MNKNNEELSQSGVWMRHFTSHLANVEAMQFIDHMSYLAIVEWMKGTGDTWALANEIQYRTPIMLYPGGPTGTMALEPTDWLVHNPSRAGFWRLTNEQFCLFYGPIARPGESTASDLRRDYEECVRDLAACKAFKQIEEVERAFSDADAAARAFAAVLDEADDYFDIPNEFRWKVESVLAQHPGFGSDGKAGS